MSSFWRFSNGYSEVPPINRILANGFIKDKEAGNDGGVNGNGAGQHDDDDTESYSSSNDSEQVGNNNIDNELDNDNAIPNLAILGSLLDEQELLDELSASNIKLIEYLRHREVLEKLVGYITSEESNADDQLKAEQEKNESGDNNNNNNDNDTDSNNNDNEDDEYNDDNNGSPSRQKSVNSDSDSDDFQNYDQPETAEEVHSRRAHVAAEILSAGAWSLTDSFMENTYLLDQLWSILDKPSPLSMLLSTYFMKINEHLLEMKIEEMLNFILKQNNIVDRFLKHIDNPPLMDFLLKVLSTDKPESPTGIIELLKDQELVPKLISFLDPSVHPSIQSAAGDFIKAFVTISANSNADNTTIGSNELTRELVSTEIMEKLCKLMLNGGTSLSNGVGIIIEIIRKNNSDYDLVPVLLTTIESHPPTSRDPIYLGYLIKVFAKNLPSFTKMLQKKSLPDLKTPFGTIEPLGFERFKICELIAELLHCSNMGLLNDEFGEEIVEERNIARRKIIESEKKHQQNGEETDEKVDQELSKDVGELNIGNEEKEQEEEENEEKEEKEKDKEQALKPELQSEPDSDVEVHYDEAELKLRKNPVVGDELKIVLIDDEIILEILKMFFKFPWNNFLHNVVFDIVQQILNGSMDIGYNKYLAIDLFGRGEINKLIVNGQNDCERYERETGLRLGYMGHLTLIAEEVVKFTALYPPSSINEIITKSISTEEWTHYVTETLVDTREKYNALLGDDGEEGDESRYDDEDGEGDEDDGRQQYAHHQHPEEHNGLSLDPNVDHDIMGSGYQEKEGDNDQFSRYMSQQLTNNLPDKFGSSDEDEEDDDLIGWHNQHYTGKTLSGTPGGVGEDDDEDDYVDPNDDGQSYVKPDHPLYSKMMHGDKFNYENKEEEEEEDAEEDDEAEEADEDVEAEAEEEEASNGLKRSTSKGELNWDEEEQARLINMANFIKNRSPSPSRSPSN